MNELIHETEVLENAIIAFTEGAADEKHMALNSLQALLVSKNKAIEEFEKQAPGYQLEMFD